jgi:hypothetical protein
MPQQIPHAKPHSLTDGSHSLHNSPEALPLTETNKENIPPEANKSPPLRREDAFYVSKEDTQHYFGKEAGYYVILH